MSRSQQYRGDLSQTTLPEMLHSIHRFQVAGMIEARRRGMIKRVYIKEGTVLHATSSDIQDSLGAFLRRTGKLSEEEFKRTMAIRREHADRRYGAVLVAEGLMSPGEVYETIRAQIEAIVWSLFYWDEGEVSFSIGELDEGEMFRIHLPMPQVILHGIERAPNAKALVSRLGRRSTVFEPAYDIEDLIAIALSSEQYAVLGLVDGERTLYEICTHGPLSAADNAKLLYAYTVLGLIRRTEEEAGNGETRESGQVKIRYKTEREPQVEEP